MSRIANISATELKVKINIKVVYYTKSKNNCGSKLGKKQILRNSEMEQI